MKSGRSRSAPLEDSQNLTARVKGNHSYVIRPWIAAIRAFISRLSDTEALLRRTSIPLGPIRPTEVEAEYLIVQAVLPDRDIQNIGILLFDAKADHLYIRLRRDVKSYAGDESDFFEALEDEIAQGANELGANTYLAWMESTLSNTVRISPRGSAVVENYATTLDALYTEHIKPNVLQFRTHLPRYTPEAAAARFGQPLLVRALPF